MVAGAGLGWRVATGGIARLAIGAATRVSVEDVQPIYIFASICPPAQFNYTIPHHDGLPYTQDDNSGVFLLGRLHFWIHNDGLHIGFPREAYVFGRESSDKHKTGPVELYIHVALGIISPHIGKRELSTCGPWMWHVG